jgi:hypothetical protein
LADLRFETLGLESDGVGQVLNVDSGGAGLGGRLREQALQVGKLLLPVLEAGAAVAWRAASSRAAAA